MLAGQTRNMSSFVPHFIAGVSVGVISTGIFGIYQYPDFSYITALPLLTGICGALTPDMDIKSKSSMLMYLVYTVIALWLFYTGEVFYAFLLLLYSIIPQFFSHRGFIHSGIFGLLSGSGIFAIAYYSAELSFEACLAISLSYFFGFLSHILLDDL